MIISKENSHDKIVLHGNKWSVHKLSLTSCNICKNQNIDKTDQIIDNSLACQDLMPEDLHAKGKQTLPYNCECVS